jgi:cardiolipin synthase
MIKGASVNILQLRFWLSWMMTDGAPYALEDPRYYCDWYAHTQGSSIVSFAVTAPGDEIQSAMESLILGITLAKKKYRSAHPILFLLILLKQPYLLLYPKALK